MKVWIIVSVMFLMENSQVKIAETVNDSSRFFNTEKQCLNSLKNKMIDSISKLCEISKDQINIKGKTTEKLGVIGKEKAIACEVICSVIKYD